MEHHSSEYGWILVWSILLYARMKKKDRTEVLLYKFVKGSLYPNLFSLHPPLSGQESEVFQIDANLRFTAAIAEMLIQSHTGKRDSFGGGDTQ